MGRQKEFGLKAPAESSVDWLAVVVNLDLSVRVRPYLRASRVGPLRPGSFFWSVSAGGVR